MSCISPPKTGLLIRLRPRAEMAGADLTRLYIVEGWTAGADIQPFSLSHISLLSEAIKDLQARLVILDPLQAFLGADIDMHRTNEVRPLMMQIHRLASMHRCSILAIRHLTKAPGTKAMYRGQGSIDFTAAARSVLFVGESPEDEARRVMAHDKNQYGPKGMSIVFGISDDGFSWYGTMDIFGR